MYNPSAIMEGNDQLNIKAIYRNQWVGFEDHSTQRGQVDQNIWPRTFVLNTAFQLQKDSVLPSRLAFGIHILNDRLGYMSTNTAQIQTAYQIPFTKSNSKLSIGVGLGITQFGYNNLRIKLGVNSDSTLSSVDQSMDISFGIFFQKEKLGYRFSKFYVGLSGNHLNTPTFRLNYGTPALFSVYSSDKIFNFMTGMIVKTGNSLLTIEPSLMLTYVSSIQLQANLIANYNSTFRAGVGYRQAGTTDATSLIVGYQTKKLQVGYSYDIVLSKIRTVSNGSHEIYASYAFRK